MPLRRREKLSRVRVGEYVFVKKGISRFDLTDPYHMAVSLSWPRFLAAMLGLYFCVNLLFATLYALVPGAVANARPGNVFDAFFFSVETLATVGYGEMYPGGLYGHMIAAVEIMSGVSFTAILTGLTFVRFARPRAKFLFASNPIVTMHNGQPTLMLRVANGRPGTMADAKAKLSVLLSETTVEGNSFRSARELRLQRHQIPIFPLTWTLMHVMDEKSPLHGMDEASFTEADARLFASLEARDPSIAAVVQDVRTYPPDAVRWGMHYADVISAEPDGAPMADLTRLDHLEVDSTAGLRRIPGWTETEEPWTSEADTAGT